MSKWQDMFMMGYLKHNLEEVTPKSCNFLPSMYSTVTRTFDCMAMCTSPCWSNDICAMICTRSYQIRSISTDLVSILIASVNWKQRAKLKMKKVSVKSTRKYLQNRVEKAHYHIYKYIYRWNPLRGINYISLNMQVIHLTRHIIIIH
jgi:hypothetical protein